MNFRPLHDRVRFSASRGLPTRPARSTGGADGIKPCVTHNSRGNLGTMKLLHSQVKKSVA